MRLMLLGGLAVASIAGAFAACVSDAPVMPDGGTDAAADDVVQGDGSTCAPGDHQCDPKSCGAPNHDCLGGACVGGVCQPVTLAMGLLQPIRLALDADYVYWNNLGTNNGENSDGSIMRVRKDGTDPKTLAASQSAPLFIFLSGSDVFWNNFGTGAGMNGTIQRTPATGGAITPVYSNVTGGPAITADGTDLYWYGGGGVFRGTLNGQTPTKLTAAPSGLAGGIAVDATRVFYGLTVDNTPLWYVAKSAVDAGGGTSLGTEHAVIGLFTVPDAGALYFSNYAGGTVRRVDLASLDAGTIAMNQASPITGAADDTFVYWAAGTQLARTTLDGKGTTTILATHPKGGLYGVAVDDKAIYFSHRSAGLILKLAKP